MFRTCAALLLPAVLLLHPGQSEAQWRQPYPNFAPAQHDDLPGHYTNVSGGGHCEVEFTRRGYLFTNENGSQALFGYYAPGKMRMLTGNWNPTIDVTVNKDRRGRTVLRFDEPFAQAGFWVSDF